MSKRSASSSPVEENHGSKKAKLEALVTDPVDQPTEQEPAVVTEVIDEQSTQEENADDDDTEFPSIDFRNVIPKYAYTFMVESTAQQSEPHVEEHTNVTEPPTKRKPSKASQGFTPWRPKANDEPTRPCESHWGIIPRSGDGVLEGVTQCPARTSNGEVEPPLRQDRKGSVRVKKGAHYINGYDQAYHLWVPLMNLRPRPGDQQPKREPIKYMCEHGMPDWSNSDAIGVANKAVRNQIKVNAHKDDPYTDRERNILAAIFREQPDIALFHAAKIFNDRAHSLEKDEQQEGGYPKGRFTESIQHEYRIYKSSYDQGQAPTSKAVGNNPATEKDIPLEKEYKSWLVEKKKAETAAKKAAKETEKAAKSGGKKTKPATNGEEKPRKPRQKKNDEDKKATGKMSETSDVKKPPRFTKNLKGPMTKEQEEYADAKAQAFLDQLEAEEKARAGLEGPLEPAAATTEESRLPEGREQTPEPAGGLDAGEVRSRFPSSPSVGVTVASAPHSVQSPTANAVQQGKTAHTPDDCVASLYPGQTQLPGEPLSDNVVETQPVAVTETTVIEIQTTTETQVVTESAHLQIAPVAQQPSEVTQAAVEQIFVEEILIEQPARAMEIDENYDEDDLF